jgi:hypothetical protein
MKCRVAVVVIPRLDNKTSDNGAAVQAVFRYLLNVLHKEDKQVWVSHNLHYDYTWNPLFIALLTALMLKLINKIKK